MRSSDPVPRRPLLKAFAGGATALAAVAAGTRVFLDDDSGGVDDRSGAITLSSDGDYGLQAMDLELGDRLLPAAGAHEWRSKQLPTSTHSMVGFTWQRNADDPDISIKSRRAGTWTTWQRVPRLHDVPDSGSAEWSGTVGTQLVWIGDADGIEIRVGRARPRGLTLVLLHPSRDLVPRRFSAGATLRSGQARVPQPDIWSRADWGADERWRDGDPVYNDTIRQVHVHHTVNSNTYSRDDVPGLIRGMYRYHTHNLGWSDIAYNFLVDRFGRIWAGRAGGVDRAVRGAHTLGFNATSTGVSCIGNFETARPTEEMLDAVAAVAAWKLDGYDRSPLGTVRVRSEGSDRYRVGQVVELPVIDGHRDTNDTACPGRHVYAALPEVRERAKALIDRYHDDEPTLAVRAEGRHGHAVITVRVEDPGGASSAPTGSVTVEVGERSKTRSLDDGTAVVQFGRFKSLPPAEHPVRVTYRGSGTQSTARATTTVTVE